LSKIDSWLELHPAEKRQPWAVAIPELSRQAWEITRRVEPPFQRVHHPVLFRRAGRLPLQQTFSGQACAAAVVW
jgi:hypothetical protein